MDEDVLITEDTAAISTGQLRRSFEFDRASINEDERTVEIAFSSESPVERWFGHEILGHKRGQVELGRLKNGAPLLLNHDVDQQIGVVEKVKLGGDRVGRAVVRFGRSGLANEIFQDVVDGIRGKTSTGYVIHEMKLEEARDDGPNVYRATIWEPYEVSIVSVPADDSVGVGRATDDFAITTRIAGSGAPKDHGNTDGGTRTMPPEDNTPPAPATPPEGTTQVRTIADPEATASAVSAERARIADITALADSHGHRELATSAIAEGWSLERFQRDLLSKIGSSPPIPRNNGTMLNMDQKEVRRYNVLKALNAQANPTDRRAQEDAAFEIECSQEAAKQRGKEARGLIMPADVCRRDLTVGTGTAGGHTVATDYQSLIEKLDNMSIALQRGTALRDLEGPVAFPRQTGGATAYWVAESGSGTESAATFDQVTLNPKTVTGYSDISRKLLIQSSIDIQAFVETDIAKRIALALDLAAINGSGVGNQPQGILQATGVGTFGGDTNGIAPTWAHMVDAITAVAQDNAMFGDMAWLTNAKVLGKLRKTPIIATYDAKMIYEGGDFFEMPVLMSNNVPSNLTKGSGSSLSAMILGNWTDLLVGLWSGVDLLVDPYTGSTSGTVRVTIFQDADVALRHPESFAIFNDMITT